MRVALIGGVRTPFVRAGGQFSKFSTLDLGKHVVVGCVESLALDAAIIEELHFGTVLLDPRIPNLAREIVLRSGLPKTISGHFVANNCITGLLAASTVSDAIVRGRIKCGLAGGAESMSRPTLTFPGEGEQFFFDLNRAKGLSAKTRKALAFRPRFVAPHAPSPKEPSTSLTMGQHCEIMVQEFGVTRAEQDQLALESHQRAELGRASGVFAKQILPLAGVSQDGLVRADTSLEKLSKLPSVFDRTAKGTITAGNASALTDGASVVCLMSEELAREQGKVVRGYIDAIEFASLPPGDGLLMGPGIAVPRLLKRLGLSIADIDLFEIHEAFSGQVLCNLKVWERGWSSYPGVEAIGAIPRDRMNVFGGSIALGHPFAATGGRLLLNACDALRARSGRRALISICAAGGGAAAALVSVD
jgi:acetyl-CoA acetyltransferase family protein